MTKRDFVVKISAETGIVQQDVLAVVQKLLDHITDALKAGEHIEFRDFGAFDVVMRKARTGRNPNRPTDTVHIPPRRTVKFKPGKKMRQLVMDDGTPVSDV